MTATATKWKVEMLCICGWDDAGWELDGAPERFDTKEEAEVAIDEFIADQHKAADEGMMTDKYDRRDYRAVATEK